MSAILAFAGCGDDPASPETDPAAPSEPVEGTLAATRLPRSFFIDPRFGNDANAGTKAAPFKTLAHGLSLAIFGDTMRLAVGGYSPSLNGERFTNKSQKVTVPAGVTILGTPAEDFTSQLHGAPGDSIGLDLQGGAIIRDLVIVGFQSGIRAVKGTQTVKGVFFDQNRIGFDARGTAQATLLGSSVVLESSNGVQATQQAKVTLDGSTITAGGPNCDGIGVGIMALDASRIVTRNGTALTNIAGLGVLVQHGARATLGSTTISRDLTGFPSCIPDPSIIAHDSSSLTITGSKVITIGGTSNGAFNSVGLRSLTQGQITIKGTKFTGHKDAGIEAENIARISVASSTFESSRFGIYVAPNALNLMTVTGSTFTKDSVAVFGSGFKLRGSKVTGNKIGLVLTAAQTDLGTLAAPGNNVFTGNAAGSLELRQAVQPGTTQAAGNTWKALTQGSDSTGHYPKHPVVSGGSNTTGANFNLPFSSTFKIQL